MEYRRVDEPTPAGGCYSIIYFYDDERNPVDEKDATCCEIVEYDENNERIQSTYGFLDN